VAPSFPFSAIVGQETLKRALLLGIIQPALGGVLIRGTKGVAKSTAVRALASLLPPIETRAGCPFQRAPEEEVPVWPLPGESPVVTRPVSLVELPLGATEDRVLGALHLEKALRGERVFEPGLLAAANRGILYIDEVNLLPDHLVDVLLDAAASGIHRVEREGLSLTHPSRFVLVGTMNPEEGELRPQLLDRFGLTVDVADLSEPADRAEAVRRRLAYEAEPEAFVAAWRASDADEAERIQRARELLPRVSMPETVLHTLIARCLGAGVEGLRADLTLSRAACAWAAYQGRGEVMVDDVDAVAELALAHRRTTPPEPPKGPGSREQHAGSTSNGPKPEGKAKGDPALFPRAGASSQILPSSGLHQALVRPALRVLADSSQRGRWQSTIPEGGKKKTRLVNGHSHATLLAWAATIRAAAPFQRARQRQEAEPLILHASDLRSWRLCNSRACLLLFVVDTSGSMAAWQRMRQTKAAILALLVQAYRQRDLVALLAFHGSSGELVLPPRRGLRLARQALEKLPVGGATPLAAGLAACHRLIALQKRKDPRLPIWTVILTDGRANVGASGDPWQEVLGEARWLALVAPECLVVDTEVAWPCFGKAQALAQALDARYLPLEHVLGRPLPDRPALMREVAS
jgi:magnesium chelatase subunit D